MDGLKNMQRLASAIVVSAAMLGGTAQAQQPLAMATGSPGGGFYAIGAGLAAVLDEKGIVINTEQGGGTANIMNVQTGQADLGFSMSVPHNRAVIGLAPYPEAMGDTRGLAFLFNQMTQIAVLADSNVHSVADLAGQRFALQTGAAGSTPIFQEILAAYGLEEGDLDVALRGGPGDGATAMRDGQAIGFHATTTAPFSAMVELTQARDLRLLEIPNDVFETLRGNNPGFVQGLIPGGLYRGIDEDVTTVADVTVLIAHKDMDEQLAYDIVRAIYESNEAIRAVHPVMRDYEPEMMTEMAGVEMHPGAERFYREIGLLQ